MAKKTHLTLAGAAAALFLSGGAALADHHEGAGEDAKVRCMGVNACKGASECATATNGCKGQNACKGQGWVSKDSKEQCEADGGKVAS